MRAGRGEALSAWKFPGMREAESDDFRLREAAVKYAEAGLEKLAVAAQPGPHFILTGRPCMSLRDIGVITVLVVNAVERGIRPTKLGMKNWLFIGHPSAGWRSAVIYSIIGTCRLVGVNPEAYLTWALTNLSAATTMTAYGYLPHDYAAFIRR